MVETTASCLSASRKMEPWPASLVHLPSSGPPVNDGVSASTVREPLGPGQLDRLLSIIVLGVGWILIPLGQLLASGQHYIPSHDISDALGK